MIDLFDKYTAAIILSMDKEFSIAIDGPVASGKTVIGRLVARNLGFPFLDTGVMYRAIAWAALDQSVHVQDIPSLELLARLVKLDVWDSPEGNRVSIDNRDITEYLRLPEVEHSVSKISEIATIRDILVSKQRAMAKERTMVLAGRDIGTVVLPEAKLKFFLKASTLERAKRRYNQLSEAGHLPNLKIVTHELEDRDRMDTERTLSPLRIPVNAHVINTDKLSIDQVVQNILDTINGS